MRIVQVSTVFKNCNSGYFLHMRVLHARLKLQGLLKALYPIMVLWGRRERQDHVHFILYDVILLHGTFVLTMHPEKHLPLSQLLIGHYASEEV